MMNELKRGTGRLPRVVLAAGLMAALALGAWGCAPAASSGAGASSSTASSAASESADASPSSASGTDVDASTSASAAQGQIKVSVSLSEDVVSPEAADTPLQFADEQIDVMAPQGATAVEVLQATGREIQTQGIGAAEEVVGIGGLVNGAAGEQSRWTYQVNGQDQQGAPGACVLQDGDSLAFIFLHA